MAGSIVISLLMATGSFETDTKRAERRLRAFKREAEQIGRAVGVALGVAATAVVGAFTAMIARGRELVDQQAKLAQQLTTTYDSINTLSRAGELAGVTFAQIATAGRTLEVNLGKAAQGIGAQEDAVAALGLKVQDLIDLPLDQKIAVINRALQDNVGDLERAAVAADLFGSRSAAAIALVNADTIAQARKESELFGTALSDVDAAQVELANDAMGAFGESLKGIQTQLAVQVAPLLKGVGDEFLIWAENAGGMQNVVLDAFGHLVDASGFVVDAIAGIGRAFKIAADVVIIGGAGIRSLINEVGAGLARLVDLVPGIDMGDVIADFESDVEEAESVVRQAFANIGDTLEEPLPSERFDEWLARVRVTTAAAAEATVAARQQIEQALAQGPAIPTLSEIAIPDDAIQQILDDLDLTVDGFERAAKVVEATRTQVERLEQQIAETQELVSAGFLTEDTGAEVLERLRQQLADVQREKNVFLEEASRGTQRILADAIRSGFDEGADGILSRFTQLMEDLVAEAIAADLAKAIFGAQGVGSGGGFVGAIGSFFGGGRAGGGGVSAGSVYRVNEIGTEFFRPNTSGQVIPIGGGGGGVELHIHNDGNPMAVDRTNVSRGPDGRTLVQAWVRSEVQGMLGRGELDRSFAANYGMRRRPT